MNHEKPLKKRPLPSSAPPYAGQPAPLPLPPPPAPDGDDIVDLADLAPEEAGGGGLEELRLGQNEVSFALFTARGARVALHYEEDAAVRSYHHCLGGKEGGCPPCLAGRKPSPCLLLPCLDPVAERVVLLRLSTAEGPHRLYSLLRPHLRGPNLAGTLFTVERDARHRYHLTTAPFPPATRRGLEQVRRFLEDWKAGRLRLRDAYPTVPAAELAALPALRAALQLRGLLPAAEEPAPGWDLFGEDELDEEDPDDGAAA